MTWMLYSIMSRKFILSKNWFHFWYHLRRTSKILKVHDIQASRFCLMLKIWFKMNCKYSGSPRCFLFLLKFISFFYRINSLRERVTQQKTALAWTQFTKHTIPNESKRYSKRWTVEKKEKMVSDYNFFVTFYQNTSKKLRKTKRFTNF